MNKVILMGRLGADPEMRYAASGKAVTKLRLATDSGFGDRKQTDWHSIVAFDKTAESCGKYLAKGLRVLVEGRISYRKADDGRWFTDIIADRVNFIDFQSDERRHGQIKNDGSVDMLAAAADDEIPF